MDDRVLGYLSECCKMRNGEGINKFSTEIWKDCFKGRTKNEVLEAISLAMKTTTGRLTPDKVFSCFKSAHPTPEEAWNAIPKSENDSAVITNEMAQAMGACQDSLDRNDMIGARMAFIESYKNITRGLTTRPKFFITRSSHSNPYTRQQNDNACLEHAKSIGWIDQPKADRLMIESKGGDLKALTRQITDEERESAKKHLKNLMEILSK